MNRCKRVEQLLMAGESLDRDDRSHIESCSTCRQTAVLVEELKKAGKELSGTEVHAGVVDQVRFAVLQKMEKRPNRRWILALSALGAGIMGLVFVLFAFGRHQPLVRSGDDFLAFMDDVAIVQWDEQDEDSKIDDVLYGQVEADKGEEDDWTIPLSDSYLALEDVFDI